MLVSHPETNTCSPGLCWGKEEHTESAHVPLMIVTMVSLDPEPLYLRTVPPHVSRLMAVETCHLPSLTGNPGPGFGPIGHGPAPETLMEQKSSASFSSLKKKLDSPSSYH